MPISITSRKIFEFFTGVGGGGTDYLFGTPGQRLMCRTDIAIEWSVKNRRLVFTASDDTVEIDNVFDGADNFTDQGFIPGDTIAVEGTASNDGSYTVESVDGRVLTITGAFTDETAEDGSIYGTTPVTALDYLYNIIENDEPTGFFSKVDPKAIQRFTASGLDAADVVTVESMLIGSPSAAWVTAPITDTSTGEVDDVTVVGLGIAAHVQKFRIDQVFRAPVWTRELVNNFTDSVAPDYYTPPRALKHVERIDARFDEINPEIPHSVIHDTVDGRGAWFDQTAAGTKPEYFLESVAYVDDISSDTVDAPDLGRKTNVTVVLRSRTGKFTTGTHIELGAAICDINEETYQQTPDATMIDNQFLDRFIGTAASTGNGELFGTTGQFFTDIAFSVDSTTQITLTYSIELSATIQTRLKGNDVDNRRHTEWIAIKDPAIITTADKTSNAVLIDFGAFLYNTDDDTLLGVTNGGWERFEYPDTSAVPIGNQGLFPGDPVFSVMGFKVKGGEDINEVTPTLKSVSVSIRAVKAGKEDFILETQTIDVSSTRKLKTIGAGSIIFPQIIDVDITRGFFLPEDSEFNRVRLQRDPGNNTITMSAYRLEYGFIARYEYWIAVFPTGSVTPQSTDLDIGISVEDITQSWLDLQSDGWVIVHRFEAVVEGYDGYETTFSSDATLTIADPVSGSQEPTDPQLEVVVEFYDVDETETLSMILEDDITLVRATFQKADLSDFDLPVDVGGYYGWLRADSPLIGSIFKSRLGTTEEAAELSTPWSAPPATDLPYISTRADGPIRISVYANKVVLESYFDSTGFVFSGAEAGGIHIIPRLGYTGYPT